MGLFAFADIIANVSEKTSTAPIIHKISSLWPSRRNSEMRRAAARGTLLGSILGVLPGGGAALASFSAYTLEKKVSRHPERFGKGAVEGVAGPEAANNAAAQTSFIPMLTLGIPSNGTMALMMGAMMIHNIQPGPQVITQQPVLFWGLITSMFVGNVMLVLLNLPLVGMWVKLISVPYRFLYPAILMFCVIGLFSIRNQTFEIMTAAVFGLSGVPLHSDEMRARAAAARFHPGADAGIEPQASDAAGKRRRDHVLHPPRLGHDAVHCAVACADGYPPAVP